MCFHENDILNDDCHDETCGICMLEFDELELLNFLTVSIQRRDISSIMIAFTNGSTKRQIAQSVERTLQTK